MNLSIYVLSWSSSSQMLLVWWMGGTILLFLLGVKSLKAPEEHISLVMPNSSSIGVMVSGQGIQEAPKLLENM
ncbi:hypothetical protein HanPSC8_Chr10g0409191 [Helianthus annuus]|nr:hypothetical protein HanPSC8_Chr10g0409191 [Helianthus annuus]